MKNTNTINNTNNTNAAIETASEFIYIGTQVRTEVWEERNEIDIMAFECTDMAVITGMFSGNNELRYVVTNLATGEELTYDTDAIQEWCTAQTLDDIANFRIAYNTVWDMGGCYGKCAITNEVYFKRVKQSDVPKEVEHPMWLLEVYDSDTNEKVACNWYETPGEMLSWAEEQVIDWRYTESGVVNHVFYANGIDITKKFYAKDRKRYALSVNRWNRKRIHIVIDTYQYSSLEKTGKRQYVCSICGKEHLVAEGKFLPHPVRPNKDRNGRYNHCCATCYEKYVGPMLACRWDFGSKTWMEIKELKVCGKAWNLEEAFYNLTIAEMDSIIKQGNFRKNATSLLIHCEPNSDAEKFGMQLRDRGQKRRWKAQQDAKLAEQEIK